MVESSIQSAGRGRAGKVWESPKGGLWFSIVLRPRIAASAVSLLQILAGAAARRGVEDETGADVFVKWPNDLMLDHRKLGGILVETKIVGDAVRFAVVGIGINVNQDRNSLVPGSISVFTATGREHNTQTLLKSILKNLQSGYSELDKPQQLIAEWWEHCMHRNKLVSVEKGQPALLGRNTGVNEEGHLLLEKEPGKVVEVSEGTLRILE